MKNNNKHIPILFEDEDLVAIEKPAGLLSVATEKDRFINAAVFTRDQLGLEKIYVLHRLDRETSGVLLFAKNKEAADFFTYDWTAQIHERVYIAIVEGCPAEEKGELVHWLRQNAAKRVYIAKENENGAQKAVMHYVLIKKGLRPNIQGTAKRSMVEFSLETGLTNQIRVQCAHEGYPVVGDEKYGLPIKGTGLALHARRLSFRHPKSKELIVCESKIPSFFKSLI